MTESQSRGHSRVCTPLPLSQSQSQPHLQFPDADRLAAASSSKLLTIHVRYHPPALTLVYKDDYGKKREKTIDLADLDCGTNIEKYCSTIFKYEPLFCTHKHKLRMLDCLKKLLEKADHNYEKKYVNIQTIKPHSLPLTDACLSKDGERCATSCLGSAAKLWCTRTGCELATLVGHRHAISSISMNPLGDLILTSSQDGTIKLWHWDGDADATGNSNSNNNENESENESEGGSGLGLGLTCRQTLTVCDKDKGGVVLFSKFSPDHQMSVSAIVDYACVHDLVNGVLMYKFCPEDRLDLTAVNMDKTGSLLLASPYSKTSAALWDLRSGDMADVLEGHDMTVTKSLFDFNSENIATCSLDSTVKLWDVRRLDQPVHTFCECDSEVHDIEFDLRGRSLAAGSADGSVTVWDVKSGQCNFNNQVHKAPVSKVFWNPNGKLLATCCDDGTIRLHHGEMGNCLQTFPDHLREIVNACFSYSSEYLMTASKDKTVKIHKLTTII